MLKKMNNGSVINIAQKNGYSNNYFNKKMTYIDISIKELLVIKVIDDYNKSSLKNIHMGVDYYIDKDQFEMVIGKLFFDQIIKMEIDSTKTKCFVVLTNKGKTLLGGIIAILKVLENH